jgi:hypothetical protein
LNNPGLCASARSTIDKLIAAYDKAILAGDGDEQELAKRALAKRRSTLAQASTRLDAIIDALAP